MVKVSVIILNWNGVQHKLLHRYLPSVIANTDSDLGRVIVADNGSTDNSIEVLHDEFPDAGIIALPENYGFAEGYNRAIAQVSTPYVLLLNDDVRVPEGWLEPLVAFMDANPDVAAVQPKLLSDRNPEMFEYAGACGGYLDKLGYPFCRGRIFQSIEHDSGQYDTPADVDWATGAALLVRRDLYMKAGGLDTHFFAHMEEIDLCWRIRRAGYHLYCIPQSVMYHLGGASLAMGHPRKTKLNFRNSLLMMWKNLPSEDRSRLIFRRKLLDGVAALNFLLHGQFPHVKAIFEAHREATKMIKEYYCKEEATPSFTLLSPHSTFKESNLSILWQYYVKRKKRFSELHC